MPRCLRMLTLVLLAALAGSAVTAAPAAGATLELDKAMIYIEWNSTDADFGIHFFWDGKPWRRMRVYNHSGKQILEVLAQKNLRAQGLTEGFFESAEPSTLSMAEFLDRFPEGTYAFRGRTLDGDRLVGEAEFTHTLPAPPANLSPAEGDTVSYLGFTVSFDPVTQDANGNPVSVAYYEVIVEKEADEPILQTFKVILRPTQTSVDVPPAFLEANTAYKFEVIAVLEGGNRTITESGTFTTDGP